MVSDIRLYLDENIEVAVAEQLRQRDIDIVTVRDLAVLGDADENHLARAARLGYVLCTYDADYLRLAAQGVKHNGIVFAVRTRTDIGDWIHGLELICRVYTAEDMQNHVEYL